jgi:amino acid permease
MTSLPDEKNMTKNDDIDDREDLGAGIVEEKRQQLNVFADTEDGPDFRGVSCLGAAALIAKAQFGLGVLGIPATFQALGFVPGLISLCVLCALVTWMGVVIGKFRLSHPQVHSIADAAYLLFGPIGKEVMGFAMWLLFTLSFGASALTLSIAFNSLTDEALCATAWLGIWSIITLLLGLVLRTMKLLQWGGYVAVVSIFFGVWVVSIACLTQSTPAAAPKGEPVDKNVQVAAVGSSFAAIGAAVSTQLFSLAGSGAFFTIHAEMKDQTKYIKALLMGQGFIVVNYIANSCVVYAKVGDYVASPALGSAGPLMMKVAYGISLPALIFTAIFLAHISAKYAMVRILRRTDHLQRNSLIHWGTWGGMLSLTIMIGFVIAGAVPFFNDLLGLIGAFLGTSFTLILPGFMMLYEMANGEYPEGGSHNPVHWIKISKKTWANSKRNMIYATVAWLSIAIGIYITVSGVYGSISQIADKYASGQIGSAFSCETPE